MNGELKSVPTPTAASPWMFHYHNDSCFSDLGANVNLKFIKIKKIHIIFYSFKQEETLCEEKYICILVS